MTDNDLALAIRKSQSTFNELKNRLGLDAEVALRPQGDRIFATTCTRVWGGTPVVYDGEFSHVKKQTLKLWTMIAQSALKLLESLPDDMAIDVAIDKIKAGQQPAGESSDAN